MGKLFRTRLVTKRASLFVQILNFVWLQHGIENCPLVNCAVQIADGEPWRHAEWLSSVADLGRTDSQHRDVGLVNDLFAAEFFAVDILLDLTPDRIVAT
jgi:hypothetical protein